MSDEDIKKALECCLAPKHDCSYCLLEKEVHCTSLLHKNILALINRQQAEIEQLKSLCTSNDVIIKAQEAEIERLQKKYDRAMDNLKAVLKEREDVQNV